MTLQEAKDYIARLTQEEKVILNEMLKDLEQKRQPASVPLASEEEGAQ